MEWGRRLGEGNKGNMGEDFLPENKNNSEAKMEYFECGNEKKPQEMEFNTALAAIVPQLKDKTDEKDIAKAAMVFARLYLHCMHQLEAQTVFSNNMKWCVGMDLAKTEPTTMKTWKKGPGNETLQMQTLVARMMTKLEKNNTKKKRGLSDSDAAADPFSNGAKKPKVSIVRVKLRHKQQEGKETPTKKKQKAEKSGIAVCFVVKT